MQWTRKLKGNLPQSVQTEGAQFFRTGAVRIERGARNEVDAFVEAKAVAYPVEIRLDDNVVVGKCSCAVYIAGDVCEHIWATLLTAESEGYLGRIAFLWEPYIATTRLIPEPD